MSPTVRFAPSPTGHIHIGNLRTALLNWLFAKEGGKGGRFILRYDDTDVARSRTEYADSILEDLLWLGLKPDEIHHQSARIAYYDAAVAMLQDKGLLYPCYETAEELDRKRKRLAARGLPPVYGRDALRLNEMERQELEAKGRQPHWRFLLPNFVSDPAQPVRTDITWDDLVRGPQSVDLSSLSDPVLVREDGSYLYTLPSVVDDGALGVTHIIRGDDHVTNTGVQIALSEALGLTVPAYGHHNLLTTLDGEGLSKRSGALSLRSLRADGIEPMAVASLAALVGLSGSIEAVENLSALAERVKLSDVSSSASKFDPAEVERLNAGLVHGLDYAAVSERLAAMGVPADRAEAFWLAVRANCARVADALVWRDVVFGDLREASTTPVPVADTESPHAEPVEARGLGTAPVPPSFTEEDRAFLVTAFDLLPPEPWSHETWKTWTTAVKEATGRKGKPLFMPLRQALTGLDHGPELADLLPLIGRERALTRRP